ncbi:MAG TPA: helicase C-terminal domain-containing protein [Gemmatimonadales bacterium]|nr:helicase C-terminal domain-containing protein [Gemmatimonadales bacterium]
MNERLSAAARETIRREIAAAGGNEVSFVATISPDGIVTGARAVARGTVEMVLALPGVARRGEMLLHNHPSGRLEPSSADLSVAARAHDDGIGFGIVDNAGERLYVVVEVPKATETTRLDPFDVIGLLGERGPIAQRMGSYEDRQSQRDLTAHLVDAYNDGGVLLLEAGTGVGKSFAYLVPALAWARANNERTIVSTNTINLQEQLVGKDLPLLAEALGTPEWTPTFALLKGWRNYLCRARLEVAAASQQSLLEGEKLDELLNIVAWAAHTADGSLSDLPVPPSGEVWDEVSAEGDLCPRIRCRHFDRCFVFQARRRAAQADIVVVNHHLLASDLAVRQASDNWEEAAVLPAWKRLILDEAHHLEDVAAGHLGRQVSSRGIRRILGRLERNGKGLIPSLQRDLATADDLLSRASLDLVRERLIPAVGEARRAAEQLMLRLFGVLDEAGIQQLRFDDDFARHPAWEEGLRAELDTTVRAFGSVAEQVETISDRMAQVELTERRLQLLNECRGVLRRLESASDALNASLRPAAGRPPEVRWMERTGPKGQALQLAAVPLDLAPILRELLFQRTTTVGLTSATLAAGGDFSFLASRIGLAGEGSPVTVQEVFPSPFDYREHCLLGLPDDVPDPREDEYGHDTAVADVVCDLAWAADGGLFVLFTSHAQLRRVGARIRETLGGRFPILLQGEAQRDQLVRRFREAGNAILLGTDSFWEGVDVPGRALRGLVLAKLPFKVPSEPLTAARLERLAEQGEDGFFGYLLPHAALKLKQGFGRLIRGATDVGAVVLLDPRVVRKRYGPMLLEGLPPAERVIGPWAQVRTRIEDFFARHGIGAMP